VSSSDEVGLVLADAAAEGTLPRTALAACNIAGLQIMMTDLKSSNLHARRHLPKRRKAK
jgi:ABC-type cobalamin transport system permease subunit